MEANKVRLFWMKVDQTGDCWNWVAAVNHAGYGLFSVEKKSRLAHRVSWVIHHGEIPIGCQVLHKCDNPSCIRPSHLWIGKYVDNMRDMHSKMRSAHHRYGSKHLPRGEFHHFHNSGHKITREIARKIRSEIGTQREVSGKYLVSKSLVSLIRNNKIWKD
jgi:hypothetical protein